MTDKLKSTESNTVTGDAFYNREIERRLIREKVESGEHQLLTGQRRMGKSSIAREIGRALTEEKGVEWNYVFVDIQYCASGAEFVARFAEALYKHPDFNSKLKSWLATGLKLAGKIEKISAIGLSVTLKDYLNEGNWQDKGSELFQTLELSNKRTYLVFDEFPDVVNKVYKNNGIEGVGSLLDWLRSETQSTVVNQKISILLSGSIGLEPILRRLNLSNKINNLAVYRLKPWKRGIAKSCFQALANYRNIHVDNDAIEYLLDELGIYIPFHIQRSWAKLYEYLQEEEKENANQADLEHVFKKIILKSESDSLISHYEERLEETLGEEYYLIAIQLLDKMCAGALFDVHAVKTFKQDIASNVDVHYILNVLTHDGYLDEDDGGWMFKQSLLRQWWQKRKSLR